MRVGEGICDPAPFDIRVSAKKKRLIQQRPASAAEAVCKTRARRLPCSMYEKVWTVASCVEE